VLGLFHEALLLNRALMDVFDERVHLPADEFDG